MANQVRPTTAYARAHYAARKRLGLNCEHCGATQRLEAALRPETPAERLVLDPNIKTLYSLNTGDYFTLCVPCHRVLDHVELRPNCRRGHAYTPENTSIKRDGSRRCKTCHRENEARRLANPGTRAAKSGRERGRVLTVEQRARKTALQRLRRQRAGFEAAAEVASAVAGGDGFEGGL